MFYYIRAAGAVIAITVGLSFAIANDNTVHTINHSGETVLVKLETSEGDIVLALDAMSAPKTVANFLAYVERKHYDGTVFHRVIDGFMMQGGGLDANLNEKPTMPPIENESNNGLKNIRYSVAMARLGSDPHSATCQFFVSAADNSFLNRDESEDGFGYAVFGTVSEGQEVVEKICKSPTHTQPNPAFPPQLMQNVPIEPIVINKVTVLTRKD